MPDPQMSLKTLSASDFIPLNLFAYKSFRTPKSRSPLRNGVFIKPKGGFTIITDLVYAQHTHEDNHFEGLYHKDARLIWAHRSMVAPVLLASMICYDYFNWFLKINDCLRPVEAQEGMEKYGYDPSLVMRPGEGAHPRGMAIDVQPFHITLDSQNTPVFAPIDMGTRYDEFTTDLKNNRAARDYTDFGERSVEIVYQRKFLHDVMIYSANMFGQDMFGLKAEWFDFRMRDKPENGDRKPRAIYFGDYAPVRERDLPSYMHLVGQPTKVPKEVEEEWKTVKKQIIEQLRGAWRSFQAIKRTVEFAPVV